jgi:hypothetical protein
MPTVMRVTAKGLLYGGGMAGSPRELAIFEMGMHQASLVSFAITIVAAVVSHLSPSNHVQIDREPLA